MNKTKKIIIVLLALINGTVLYNAIFHDPNVGYDAPAHIKNIKVISEFRFPEKGDTYL